MMDMEMNAGLDDDGSESSQSSDEGSSVSDTFCQLEKDYARVLNEMKANKELAAFEADYTKLFESLYSAHRSEKELLEKYTHLEEEFADSSNKLTELTRTVQENIDTIEKLKHEIVDAKKLADAAHTREQNAQEVIENLRVSVRKLNQEIEQKNKQLVTEEESVAASKQKEGLLKERKKLMGEMDTLRQRLENMSAYTEELERKTSAVDHKINEMQENLDCQSNEISKERRLRQRAESEVQQLQEELTTKTDDLQATLESLQAATMKLTKLEESAREQKVIGDRMQKEINRLTLKRTNLQSDLGNASVEIDSLREELAVKDKELKNLKQQVKKLKDDSAKHQYEKDAVEKKWSKTKKERLHLEEELGRALAIIKDAELETLTLQKQQMNKQQYIEVLLRGKNTLERINETSKEQRRRIAHELSVSEHARKKIGHALDLAVQATADTKKQLEQVEKERNKHHLEAQELAQEVEHYISEVKLKQVEIFDYKKRLAEAETKYRQRQDLFEAVRAERDSYSKSLLEAQDEIQELKSKLKILGHQIEQLKEDVATKEANLSKKDFVLGRVEKEKDGLKVELQSCRKEVSDLRHEIEKMKEEEKRLRHEIHRADMDIARQRKDIENVLTERDIIGAQLARRNDELSLQLSQIKMLNGTLQRGEAQYNQRLEDIRLLKLEVKQLRTEKTLLAKSITNSSDLRQEILHLNRDLARERLKVVALEEELQTPLNIHRWRKLEGTDPDKYELLKKVQILQKRVIKMSTVMIDTEKKIKDTEELYINLQQVISKHPGPQVTISLSKTQKALRERGKKVKCLVSELNMYEVEMSEQKVDMERVCEEMRELKKKYYLQKRKLQKAREYETRSMEKSILPAVCNQKKFCGGGFNMTTPNPKNCFTLVTTGR